MARRPSWVQVLVVVLTGILGGWTHALGTLQGWRKAGGLRQVSYELVWPQRFTIPLAAVAIVVTLQILSFVRDDLRKRQILQFLNHLHQKNFGQADDVARIDCRVTLFVPARLPRLRIGWPPLHRVLRFYARSGAMHPRSRTHWSLTASERGDFDGVAGRAWAWDGVVVELPDLPDPDDSARWDAYCRSTFVDPTKAKKLSWRARSYNAVVLKDQAGNRVGVLMFESLRPQMGNVDIQDDAAYFQALLVK